MQRFQCPNCAQEVYFENSVCLNCSSTLFYDPVSTSLVVDAIACANRDSIGCNWTALNDGQLCESCAITEVIPDLSVQGNVTRWRKVEMAKRRLIHALRDLSLPLDAPGERYLRFWFMADGESAAVDGPVLTGHDNGRVTLNIAEADDATREATRIAMGEPYRTLLGHFRHESGHFYWDVLVSDANRTEAFREVFGDERQDYDVALARHYAEGSPADWQERHVSAYAAAHPWEDFAETWAHALHILDALETARAYGLAAAPGATGGDDPDMILADWLPLSLAMNAMNRSLGHPDFYPFQTAPTVGRKLGFVLRLLGPS
jgi:hypothetical protein